MALVVSDMESQTFDWSIKTVFSISISRCITLPFPTPENPLIMIILFFNAIIPYHFFSIFSTVPSSS